jgi:hypothetical protein
MIRIERRGAHSLLLSTLCGRCPQGIAGCCAAPPAVAWADVGRIVALGGRDFLLEEIREGRLRPIGRGLAITRKAASEEEGTAFPARCVYHGPRGCTIAPERRSATCNYYVCDDALADGGEAEGNAEAKLARLGSERLTALYGRWDLEMGEAVAERFPAGAPWDAGFLEWLGEEWGRRCKGARRMLRVLEG